MKLNDKSLKRSGSLKDEDSKVGISILCRLIKRTRYALFSERTDKTNLVYRGR